MENISEQQLTIFDELCEEVKIIKPIRLIELFAGYGSQDSGQSYRTWAEHSQGD